MGAASFLRKLIGGGARAGVDRRTEELVSLCNALIAESGEYASTALARDALAAYHKCDEREYSKKPSDSRGNHCFLPSSFPNRP